MSQSLYDFVKEAKTELEKFEEYWRKNNIEDQENFPIEMADGDEGAWWEHLQLFNDGER